MIRILGSPSWVKIPILGAALVALMVALALAPAHAASPLAPQANAGPPYVNYDIDCPSGDLEEGADFEVIVRNKNYYQMPAEEDGIVMNVTWFTSARSAKENDYTAVNGENQIGNHVQSWVWDAIAKTFYTTDDTWSEKTERFVVWYFPYGYIVLGNSCNIDITDNDGPGAWKTWIDSTPGENQNASYWPGDTIRLKQQFTEDVTVRGDVMSGSNSERTTAPLERPPATSVGPAPTHSLLNIRCWWMTRIETAFRSMSQTTAAVDPSLPRPKTKGSTQPTKDEQSTPNTRWAIGPS